MRLWDIASNSVKELGRHDAAVKEIRWVPQLGMIVSGSWDKTIRWWDVRTPGTSSPALTVQIPDRCYAMDTVEDVLVVGCAGQAILAFDMSKPQNPVYKIESALKMETRCVALFPDKSGLAIGSSEGRCSLQYFQPNKSTDTKDTKNKDFSFKCHRDQMTGLAYPVHDIAFHNAYNRTSFITCGGDGTVVFWEKEGRSRLGNLNKTPMAVTHAKFSADGSVLAYATGYDWSKGVDEFEKVKSNPKSQPRILLHQVQDSEVRPKEKKSLF